MSTILIILTTISVSSLLLSLINNDVKNLICSYLIPAMAVLGSWLGYYELLRLRLLVEHNDQYLALIIGFTIVYFSYLHAKSLIIVEKVKHRKVKETIQAIDDANKTSLINHLATKAGEHFMNKNAPIPEYKNKGDEEDSDDELEKLHPNLAF